MTLFDPFLAISDVFITGKGPRTRFLTHFWAIFGPIFGALLDPFWPEWPNLSEALQGFWPGPSKRGQKGVQKWVKNGSIFGPLFDPFFQGPGQSLFANPLYAASN